MKLRKVQNLLPISAAMITLISSPVEADASTYTVKKNDTLSDISNQYGVSVQSLKQANNKTTSQIYAGERLTIPNVSKPKQHTPQYHAT